MHFDQPGLPREAAHGPRAARRVRGLGQDLVRGLARARDDRGVVRLGDILEPLGVRAWDRVGEEHLEAQDEPRVEEGLLDPEEERSVLRRSLLVRQLLQEPLVTPALRAPVRERGLQEHAQRAILLEVTEGMRGELCHQAACFPGTLFAKEFVGSLLDQRGCLCKEGVLFPLLLPAEHLRVCVLQPLAHLRVQVSSGGQSQRHTDVVERQPRRLAVHLLPESGAAGLASSLHGELCGWQKVPESHARRMVK